MKSSTQTQFAKVINVSGIGGSQNKPISTKPFWEWNAPEIHRWVCQLTGELLFPKRTNGATKNTSEETARYKMQTAVGNVLLQNLIRALSSASSHEGGSGSNPAKRPKLDPAVASAHGKGDTYQILDPSFAKSGGVAGSELPPGAILSRITLGGLVNALAGAEGGVVDTLTCLPLASSGAGEGDADADAAAKKEATRRCMEGAVATAASLPLKEVVRRARGLHRSVVARTEMDIIATTPRRIADLLCPEITLAELHSIRGRVHDTVVLGLGTGSSAHAAALENDAREVPVAPRGTSHERERYQRCDTCGNTDQASFVLDHRNGDLICSNCGTVVSESLMHEGSQFRKFEGEEDRNHHGDAPNPLFSNSHNLGTSLGGVSFQTGAGRGGFGSGAGGGRGAPGIENVLRNAHSYTEMNISQFGKEEKKTRIGYKDQQKRDAFYQMAHAGDALGLHEAVVQRAKELFAGFRDDREMVQQYKGVIAACLSEAFDQLTKDGKQILKKQAGEAMDSGGGLSCSTDGTDKNGGEEGAPKTIHARASRRNDLHSASLAGKGGLLLDKTVVSHGGVGGALDDASLKESITGQPFEKKAAATWDLDDCKSWMIEATKSIARIWVASATTESDNSNSNHNKGNSAMATPKGTKDELEGRLIEHSLKLCEYLELKCNAAGSGGPSPRLGAMGSQRVRTPRVADMGVLGIKWQHAHERGSGGRGGVGNSGRGIGGSKPGERRSRTAGQILLLLTAKKFGTVLGGDQVAGEAFHKELRAVLERESAKRRKDRKEESTMARLKQMNRKPWLQKRVQQL